MSDQRTKARLAVSEFQSALRAKFDAERDFTRAHDQLPYVACDTDRKDLP